MAHRFTEDQIVQQATAGLLVALGWMTLSAMEETLGPGGTLGSETRGEVVLTNRMRADPDSAGRTPALH